MAPSLIGTSYCLPVRLSVIVSVSAIGGTGRQSRTVSVGIGRRLSEGSGIGVAGDRGSCPSAHRARSSFRQRSLQNGRQRSSTGRVRHRTHSRASPIRTIVLACRRLPVTVSCGSSLVDRQACKRAGPQTGGPPCAGYRPGAWWRTSSADTMKITSSAMFVAWSPIRSRWRETRIRSSAGSIVAGSWQHVGQQLAEHLRLQGVELVVVVEHLVGQRRVAPDEGVERVAQHRLGDLAHLRDVDQLLDRRVADVAVAPLRRC